MEKKTFSCDFAGRKVEATFSDMAEQANGSVLVKYGDTVVMAAACMSKDAKPSLGYFPLTVSYEEKFYAGGKILGSRFMRREGRPSDNATLTSRLVDRTIRPLFNGRMRNEVQLIINLLSYDGENAPDVPAVLAASLALATSDIPWDGPIAGARVIKKDGKFAVNPTYSEMEGVEMDAVICGKDGKINMIEVGAYETPEKDAVESFKIAVDEIEKINQFQKDIVKEIGKEKATPELLEEPEGARDLLSKHFHPRLEDYIYIDEKTKRSTRLGELKKEWMDTVKERFGDDALGICDDLYEEAINEIIHKNVLKDGKRPDHRKLNEVRALYADTGLLPRAHGSGLFYRGQTHVLSVLTLGAPGDSQIVDGVEIDEKKYFMHHYNFPPFSTGETRPIRSPGRREIGHGALAEKAIKAVLPDKEQFPYTIRIVSECMASNGSTSMASVCGSTLALMDGGVPIKNPVAGIAMGLMMEDEKNYKILTDIQGPEDHHGDMDFKAAGTREGLTAIQMDVKIEGVTVEILEQALEDAKVARLHILETILKAIPEPRADVSSYAPRIVTHKIDPDKIGDLIGPGGKTINGITDETGATIDIEEDGTVFITAPDKNSLDRTLEMVKGVTKIVQAGEVYKGKVVRVLDFGAFVELTPKQDGMIHISKLAPHRVDKVTDVVNVGDTVEVKVLEVDEQGRINLSLISHMP